MSGVDFKEFVSGFLAEADELVRAIRTNLMQMDEAFRANASCPRAVREVYRALHTMKGLAGMVGVEPIVEIAHAMESVVRIAEKRGGRLPLTAFEPLLEGLKAITVRLAALGGNKDVAPVPSSLLEALAASEAQSEGGAVTSTRLSLDAPIDQKLSGSEREQVVVALAQGKNVFQVVFRPSAERAAAGVSISTIRQRVGALGEIVKTVPLQDAGPDKRAGLKFVMIVVSETPAAVLGEALGEEIDDLRHIRVEESASPVEAEEELGREPAPSRSVLRVEVARVDDAMDRLAGLLVTRFRLMRSIDALQASGADVRELRINADELGRQLRDLRGSVLGLRMISVAELLEPLPLLVRGLSVSTRKPVDVVRDVGSAEIDKAVAEPLWTALVHLVRNAIDHGIEASEARTLSGKPPRGTIVVRARAQGRSFVEIFVEDDGRGVDPAAVAKRAGAPVPTNDAGVLDLLTRPGFSTRDEADRTSGRGMGLDIVKRIVVDRLGGEFSLKSLKTRGTAFTLRVPLTLSIIDAFRFGSEQDTFLVPVAMVEELVEVEPQSLAMPPGSANARRVALLQRRGTAIPYIDLARVLGSSRDSPCAKAIIVRKEQSLFAFGVDRLLGRHEVVVRPVADPLVSVHGVTGASDLGEGRPTLVLDLPALADTFSMAESAA